MKRRSVLCLIVLIPCFAAKADLVATAVTVSGAGPYTWSYTIHLSSDESVVSGLEPVSNPVPPTNLDYGSFFTIYDFAGYVNGSCSGPAGWQCRAQNIGFTPDDVSPTDNPNLVNITFWYASGPQIIPVSTGAVLGTFSAQSTLSLPGVGSFAARAVANSTPNVGLISDNVGQTEVPADAPLVPSCTSPTTFSGVGTGTATSLASFEAAIGGTNNGAGPPSTTGFRTINWDGVLLDGTDFGGNTTPIFQNKVTAIPTNRFQSRGVVFDRAHAVANDGFLSVNPTVHFTAFSPSNTFAPYNNNVVTVNFVVPGTPPAAPTPALTRGFGAVFLDVQSSNTTSIEYFNGASSIGKYFVPFGTSGQSEFLGVVFGGPIVTSVKITLGSAVLFVFNGVTSASGPSDATADQVALDDFAYGEPFTTTFALSTVKGSPISGPLTSFSDSGGTDTAAAFAVSINWGDGITSVGTVTGSSACFTVSGTHAYDVSGTFPVTVTVNDSGGAFGVVNATANVTTIGSGDFNGDGKTDVLLRDTTGTIGMWLMNGSTVSAGAAVGAPGGSYTVAGIGDFNGDGKADILLRDSLGNLGMWLMNGTVIASGGLVGSPGGSYAVAGIGDFNGDGKADILLRDNLGNLGIWFMNGTTVTSGAFVGSPGGSYTVVGVGDFNGDGKADILLRDNLGNLGLWLMNGAAITSGALIGSPGSSYNVASVGDFNGDGKADILLKDNLGNLGMWIMNGASIISGGLVGSVAGFSVASTGDYNADTRADILLRNTTTGDVGMYLMNGAIISSGASVGPLSTSSAIIP